METRRQKRLARFALIAFAAFGLFWLAHLDYAKKISTNVIDLIPADERAPELALIRDLTDQQQARVLLLALDAPQPSRDAVNAFAASLKNASALADVVVIGDTTQRDALGRFVFTRRFDLLLPSWLAEQHAAFSAAGESAGPFSPWLAARTVAALDRFLARPESIAFQELIPHDPLLLVPSLVSKVEGLASSSVKSSDTKGPALIWAVIKDSPFSEAGQEPVFAAIDAALLEARKIAPAMSLRWTGINRFAAESRHRIEAEISWLNIASFLGVVGITCLFVRRLWKVLHLVPIVLLSTLGAWVATTMVFDRVHVLVFVIGSLLAGVAIDYGFYLYMQPALRPGEPFGEKLRRLLKPLLTSCLTTVIGFSLLFWSELPLVQQLGVFVSAGLITATAVSILYFAQLDHAFLEARDIPIPQSRRARRILLPVFLGAAIIAVVGPWRLHWLDDIRQLEIPAPALRANDVEVRALFGDASERTAYLTRGETPAIARETLGRFIAWHDAQFPEHPATSAGVILPSPADWAARPAHIGALASFSSDLRIQLEKSGYTPDSFAPFFDAWEALVTRPQATRYEWLFDDLRRELSGPLSLLFHLDPAGGPSWFLSLADHPPTVAPPAEVNTFSVAQLESLNTLFSRYRANAATLSGIGLALIGASVFIIYGLKRGIRIFAIPAGSCFFSLGLLGLCGQTLNIFHLLAAFLGVCLSHNYAIFSAENARHSTVPPPSIRISALTAAISFGVLAMSKIPVVSALGTTVALIVLSALLMVELEPFGRPGDASR